MLPPRASSAPAADASPSAVPLVPEPDSPARRQRQREISVTFFGPSSTASDVFLSSVNGDTDHNDGAFYQRQHSDSELDSTDAETAAVAHPHNRRRTVSTEATASADAAVASRRRRRKENQEKFKQIAQLADAHRPVDVRAFTRKPSTPQLGLGLGLAPTGLGSKSSGLGSTQPPITDSRDSAADKVINTELLEAYVAYSRSLGREPQIDFSRVEDDAATEELVSGRASFLQDRRPVVAEHTHWWTEKLGTRHSKRRGCVQFWAWLAIGLVVGIIMAFFLAHLSLDEVLHLDAFVEENVVVTDDYTYLYLRDEVTFRIRYDISADTTVANTTEFQVLLLYEDDFEDYIAGEPFEYIQAGSTLRTTYASLPLTEIENEEYEEVYFVIQPCQLARNPGVDYCQTRQLPTPVRSTRKVFNLRDRTQPSSAPRNLAIRRLYVNPMPNTCSASGWKAGSYFIIFLPFVLLSLFGLRVFQMLYRCESFRANLERKYKSEIAVPENEVDYWQPMPWDRKVPKTRLLGPCCWKKMRRPYEPFYTWWRHENYFTWIFFPYRNERLSRGERALIVFCSLYLTFYVLFVLVMLRDSLGANLSIAMSVLIYYVLIMILPTLGKAIFKEIFKLIFRQRRKYFRVHAAGGDTSGFSFRLAFFLQVLVTLLIAVTQLPMFYIWLYRSCTFLKQFMYFGLLAAVTRLSILGLSLDYVWYVVIKTWGWRDLCPYCTERLVHCDCFNDELLVLSVERVGPKWELILLLDRVLAKHGSYTPQFDQYTAEQLRERWQVLVERAEAHMDKVEKLRAYQAKKRVESMRRQRQRESFLNAASILGFSRNTRGGLDSGVGDRGMSVSSITDQRVDSDATRRHHHKSPTSDSRTEEDDAPSGDDIDGYTETGCSLREKKILAINSRIMLDRFEKHYDSTIVDVFHSIQESLAKKRRHARERLRGFSRRGTDADKVHDDDSDASDNDATDAHGRQRTDNVANGGRDGLSSSGSGGETMWIIDSPQQRLERRELEKKRRKRMFRVLDDYVIETVEPERDAQGNVHFVSTSDHGAGSATATAGTGTGTDARPSSQKKLIRQDSRYVQLLSRKKATPRNEDVVVVVSESGRVEMSTVGAFPPVTVVEEENESDLERDSDGVGARFSDGSERSSASFRSGDAHTHVPPPPSSRTYAVMERKPSILRQVSASATAFASWVFKLEKDDDVV